MKLKHVKLFEEFKIEGRKINFTEDELKKMNDISLDLEYDYTSYGNGYFNGFYRIRKGDKMIVLSSQDYGHKPYFIIFDTSKDWNPEIFRQEISSVEEFIELLKKFDKDKQFNKIDKGSKQSMNDELSRTLKIIADMYQAEEEGSAEHPCEYFDDGTELRELAETVTDPKLKSILNRMADYSQYDSEGSAEHMCDHLYDSDYQYILNLLEND
jgi:hypothetical protein